MTSFADLIAQGAANAWLFIPSAILLGALVLRFANQSVTTGQAMLFDINGGPLRCSAAITLVTVEAIAGVGSRQTTKRFRWLSALAARAPYLSSALVVPVSLYVGYSGYVGLKVGHA